MRKIVFAYDAIGNIIGKHHPPLNKAARGQSTRQWKAFMQKAEYFHDKEGQRIGVKREPATSFHKLRPDDI